MIHGILIVGLTIPGQPGDQGEMGPPGLMGPAGIPGVYIITFHD